MNNSSQENITQYRELWHKIVKIFKIPKDKVQNVLSAYGKGKKFESPEDVKRFFEKNSLNSVTFQLLIDISQILNDIEEVVSGLKDILRDYDNANSVKSFINFRFMIANDREGWTGVYYVVKQINTAAINIHIFNYIFMTKISNENDVTNLRYFVPIWHHFNSQGKPLKLEITSNISGDEQRVKQFFQKVPEELRNRIVFNKRRLDRSAFESGSSDILPMVCISQGIDSEKTNSYLDIIEDLIAYHLNLKNVATEEIRDALFKNWLYKISKSFSNDVYSHATDFDEVYNQAVEVYSLKNFLAYLNNLEIEKRNERLENKQIKENDLDHLLNNDLQKMSVNGLIEYFTKIYNVKRMDGEFGLLEVLKSDNVNKWLLLVFLFLLRNSLDIITNKGNNTVDNSIIDNIWSNSKTYAEGLLQLIENAQQHSNGRVAYFGMRIYKADPNAAMGTLAKEAQTRTALWRKFWHDVHTTNNIFNEKTEDGEAKYPDFIEFYVLDDAIGTDSKVSGIVDSIICNKKDSILNEEGKDIINREGIRGIYDLNEAHYTNRLDFYIQHYGMRWFKSHIDSLNGIMEIYSPYDPKVGEDDFGHKCCYSNVFKNLGETVPYYKNFYSTEYSILIPLEYGRN